MQRCLIVQVLGIGVCSQSQEAFHTFNLEVKYGEMKRSALILVPYIHLELKLLFCKELNGENSSLKLSRTMHNIESIRCGHCVVRIKVIQKDIYDPLIAF